MAINDSALGILETIGLTPALMALDAMEKASSIAVMQAELNDFLGVVIKLQGSAADVEMAISLGVEVARRTGAHTVGTTINRPADEAWRVMDAPGEYNPLIEQDVVWIPNSQAEDNAMSDTKNFALGLIETQGFTAVFEAIDTACKAANVEVVGKEKLGGGYVTVIIKGDVSAVKAAVESGSAKVDALGKLIAAHVIARPSENVLSLLPA